MPELPEVTRIGESLHRHLSSKTLINITINEKSRYFKKPLVNLQYLTQGVYLKAVTTKAKRILFHFNDQTNNRDIIMVSFLGMEGHWIQNEGKHSGVILEMGKIEVFKGTQFNITEKKFYYDDSRHFGIFNVCISNNDIEDVFKNIGPDFLNGNITLQDYSLKIKDPKKKDKQICWWMMEQKFFSGIGNYLKAEILYACRISPHRSLGSLNDNDVLLLHKYSHEIIRESYLCYGLTIATYSDPDGHLGTFVKKVYKQDKDPFGNQVIAETLSDKRTTHWVPSLQI